MMFGRLFAIMLALGGLVACSGGPIALGASQARPDIVRSYQLAELRFSAPEDIVVSESQGYYPIADIVWRGDVLGPRVPQIAAMFQTAATRNKAALSGDRPVVIDVALVRFHGVTDRTRFSVGGVYNIIFDLTVRDARTGEIIEPRRRVAANLDAPGGAQASELVNSGQTQKVRVTDFLTAVLRRELS